jgi:hypothetical protein
MSEEKDYEIFLSFSGDKSKQFAKQLKDLLKELSIEKVFFSEEDINGGDKWLDKIQMALKTSKVGIICFTEENIHKPWLFLEYGAFAYKQFLDKNEIKIIPLFLDFTKWDDNPLNTHQAIVFKSKTVEDALNETVTQLNNYIDDKKDKDSLVKKINENSLIVEKIKKILKEKNPNPQSENSTVKKSSTQNSDCDDLNSHIESLKSIQELIDIQSCCKNSILLSELVKDKSLIDAISFLNNNNFIELFEKHENRVKIKYLRLTSLGKEELLFY